MMSGPILTTANGTVFRSPICWPLMPVPDEEGRMAFPDLEMSIRQRIESVLRTSPGEQLMRPEFGAGLELLIHQPNTTEVRARTQESVMQHLRAYEPRIMIDSVHVAPGEDPRELIVSVGYRIRSTGVAGQISARVPVGAS
jgi:phage baseplate assembly protein W